MSSITDDRAAGAVLGAACGDALAAGRAPGAWTAAVASVVPVLRAAAAGESLTAESTLDAIVAAWAEEAGDGVAVPTAAAARSAARASAGPGDAGVLLGAVVVALPSTATAATGALVRAATAVARLTDADPQTVEACVLLTGAVHHAVRTGDLDLRGRLALLPEARRSAWSELLDEAEHFDPLDFAGEGGGAVQALQGAWSAIVRTPVPEALAGGHLRLALEAALPVGGAAAALAGGLLGARWGASAVPAVWRRGLHGSPGRTGSDLVRAAVLAANGGLGDGTGWPAVDRLRPSGPRVLVPHPHDAGVLLGSLAALDDLPAGVDAVVSLCRTGRRQTDREQLEVWLVDRPGRNPNLELVLHDAADAVAALRAEGRRVLLHGGESRSRTPAVAALYAAAHLGVPAPRALTEVVAVLPAAAPAPFLQEAVLRIGAALAAAAPPRPVLLVDLDTAVLDAASGVARLPARAGEEFAGRPEEAPGVVALMDPLPGAVDGFRALAASYDAFLVTDAPWGDAAAWQHRLEWVQRWFGAAAVDAAGAENPAHRRLLLGRPPLGRGAVLVSGRRDEAFDGELVLLEAGWAAVLGHLLDPARIGVPRPGAAGGRSRDRIEGRAPLTAWLLESLRARGGSASVVQVAKDLWERHEDELRRSGDLFFTWQHDLRRAAARLRDEGRIAPASEGDPGVWRLAR